MINHFLFTLYNQPGDVQGVYNPLTTPLQEPLAIRQPLSAWRGNTPAQAWEFAVGCLKIVRGSTFQQEVLAVDRRITYQEEDLLLYAVNGLLLIDRLRFEQPAAAGTILQGRPDLEQVFRQSDLPQEQAAALIVGLVRLLTEVNGEQ